VNETAVRNLTVVNVGRFLFDYVWELKCPLPGLVSIGPESGAVAQGEKVDCGLSFASSQPLTLRNCDLSLRVRCAATGAQLAILCNRLAGVNFT